MIELNEHKTNPYDSTPLYSGFSMTFDNGNTISVQFGHGNYCDNKHESSFCCNNAEIAIWNKDGKDYYFDGSAVKGYCSTDEIAEYIYLASTTVF